MSLAHLTFVAFTGLRTEHVLLDVLFAGLPWCGGWGFRFTPTALPLWLTGVVVDSQRLLHPLGTVHTGDIWQLDARLFPAPGGTNWADYLHTRINPVLDFFTGFSYGAFLYEFFAVAIFFYLARQPGRSRAMAWAFLIANVVGGLGHMLYPVAPPWYVLQHGMGPADVVHAVGSPAGCARFDAMLHIHYFEKFYARNPHVFGAMPSLHIAYPTLVVLFTWHRGWRWRIPTLGFAALVAFSAVYLTHHYIVDLLAGLITAGASGWAANRWFGGARHPGP